LGSAAVHGMGNDGIFFFPVSFFCLDEQVQVGFGGLTVEDLLVVTFFESLGN
jgi:hypothetical protein